jgi:predicted small lipoprotein YifL
MTRLQRAALAVALLIPLWSAGCGNKGPLYLPETTPGSPEAAAAEATPEPRD